MIGIALLLVAVVFVFCRGVGVNVIVANKTQAEIKNLEIRFTGGIATIPEIKAGKTYKTSVNPTGESRLELRFADASGKDRAEAIGVYMEEGYRGEIFIEISPDGTVKSKGTAYPSIWR